MRKCWFQRTKEPTGQQFRISTTHSRTLETPLQRPPTYPSPQTTHSIPMHSRLSIAAGSAWSMGMRKLVFPPSRQRQGAGCPSADLNKINNKEQEQEFLHWRVAPSFKHVMLNPPASLPRTFPALIFACTSSRTQPHSIAHGGRWCAIHTTIRQRTKVLVRWFSTNRLSGISNTYGGVP